MATAGLTERDPLLRNEAPVANSSVSKSKVQETGRGDLRVGPLEISSSTRYGILAGTWMATFLTVRTPTSVYYFV